MTYLVKLYTVLHTPPYHHYYHKCIDIHISYIVNNIIFEYAYLVPKCVWLYVFHWLQMWMELIDHRQWNIQQILWLIEQQQQNERKKNKTKWKYFDYLCRKTAKSDLIFNSIFNIMIIIILIFVVSELDIAINKF